MATFVNWSGSLRFTPGQVAAPTTTEEVAQVVRSARADGRRVRPVGQGHSSTPLVRTDDVLLSADAMAGMVTHDPDTLRAEVLPGTRLSEAGTAFHGVGMAMENLGDVDMQAIAGAIATGTHGSGLELPNLSQMLVGGELVTGTGDVLRFGEDVHGRPHPAGLPLDDDDVVRALRVNLGALGVLTSLTLQLVPSFDVHRRDWCTHVDWAVEHFDALARTNRSFDMYWYPRSDIAQVRTLDDPHVEPDIVPPGRQIHDEDLGPSHEIIPNNRDLRFDEMEYMLPYEAGLECFAEVRARIKERHRQDVAWRVLVRTVAADEALISNCYGRPTLTIALLHNAGLPYEEYFGDMEPLLQEYGGRPHWGKKHTMTAADLAPRLPRWDDFQTARQALDPEGVLLNEHLSAVLGVPDPRTEEAR
ncbi:D-arabinono-1,4-lactone oxidase [Cellulomonas bogoriensis]|uniref:Oxidoreductase n=1 Tax=Cellulomonas bogoriensis 69B4 = DSM 16987 TaxID=1386082 RepID=A0A0A0BKB2_9CELL|nr:D-arabinono-1,4-lactone oxidase [Cellulomonas bogoriensis]KGM08963.1 oxidoreductase [Cellulomonas bogoriensis 69B4 = DSM 16987]